MINLVIYTHSGKEYNATVEEYNPLEINELLNNNSINTIVIGDYILSRIDVKNIFPTNQEN